jgi:anti-sigma factor RsiW
MTPRDDTNPVPDDLRESVAAYLDGELSPEAAREVLRRLASDSDAKRGVEEMRRVADLLGLYADEPVPEGFAERVLEAVGAARADADGAPRPSFGFLRGGRGARAAAVAAAILLAVGAGVLLGRLGRPGGSGGTPEAPSGSLAALEAVPAELLESDDVARLATMTEEDFEALLAGDPEEFARQVRGGEGG